MTDTITITPLANSNESQEVLRPVETSSATGSRLIPFSVPRDQLYYWTHHWQADEREAMDELDAGLGHSFNDGKSAADWLLSDETDSDDED